MGLADYRPETFEIVFKGGSFFVKGLNLEDVSSLVRTHLPDMEALFDMYQQSKGDVFANGAAERLILKLAKDAPALAANLIALASGEPDSVDSARKLSLPLQVAALTEIGRLTFEDAGGPKKFAEDLMKLMGGMIPHELMQTAGPKKVMTNKKAG